MSDASRTETMASKLAAYALRAGVPPGELLHAYQVAIEHRLPALRDVFHPELLHPARTALILLEDTAVRDAPLLAAAALSETEFSELRVPDQVIGREFPAQIAELTSAVPKPVEAGEQLLEALLALPSGVALIALAERLDHARHLHFRDRAAWPLFYEQVSSVYLPFAVRLNDELARRFLRWSDAFRRRFLQSA